MHGTKNVKPQTVIKLKYALIVHLQILQLFNLFSRTVIKSTSIFSSDLSSRKHQVKHMQLTTQVK